MISMNQNHCRKRIPFETTDKDEHKNMMNIADNVSVSYTYSFPRISKFRRNRCFKESQWISPYGDEIDSTFVCAPYELIIPIQGV